MDETDIITEKQDSIAEQGSAGSIECAEFTANTKNDTEDIDDSHGTKTRRRKWPFIVGSVVVLIVVSAVSGFIWHEQPSFCNAICHTPMDPYYATYLCEPGLAGEDKWERSVANASSMLAATHRAEGFECLDCHLPTFGEQVSEGIKWITGDYRAPLLERTIKDLVSTRGMPQDEFCLNERCHHVASDGSPINSREDLTSATSYLARNVHLPQHDNFPCDTCHKAHRASVVYCAECHRDTYFPAGWVRS